MKLNIDEKEALSSLIDSAGWSVLLKVAGIIKKDIDNRVLSYNLIDGPEGLVIAKAQAEGADRFLLRLTELKSKMKKQDL